MLAPGRPKPKPTPETQHFWEGCKQGKLLLQRCGDTGKAYFPPRPFSPYTGTRNVEVFEASGRGTWISGRWMMSPQTSRLSPPEASR